MSQGYGPGTALVVVDMQNAFVHPDGSLHVDGAEELVAVIEAEVDAAVAAGSPVLYTQDRQPVPGTEEHDDAPMPWDVLMHAGLRLAGVVVAKGPGAAGGFSGFVEHDRSTGEPGPSRLDESLRQAEVRGLVLVGLAADVCVQATALDGRRLGYAITMPLRATRFVHAHPDGDEAAVAELRAAGVVVEEAG